jgi:hypothetical protein
MPRFFCGPGMVLRDLLGRLIGERPFERPWMAKHIDKELRVDAGRTRSRLGWTPRERLEVLRRLPFLIENFKSDPVEWHRRNEAAMKAVRVTDNLRIHRLLEKHEQEINAEFFERFLGPEGRRTFSTYHRLHSDEIGWYLRVALRQLMNAIRTRDKAVFLSYCRDLADRRFHEGFPSQEVRAAINLLRDICLRVLREDPEAEDLLDRLHGHVDMTVEFGCDQIEERFDQLREARARGL